MTQVIGCEGADDQQLAPGVVLEMHQFIDQIATHDAGVHDEGAVEIPEQRQRDRENDRCQRDATAQPNHRAEPT